MVVKLDSLIINVTYDFALSRRYKPTMVISEVVILDLVVTDLFLLYTISGLLISHKKLLGLCNLDLKPMKCDSHHNCIHSSIYEKC
jgi:hypothetical protein